MKCYLNFSGPAAASWAARWQRRCAGPLPPPAQPANCRPLQVAGSRSQRTSPRRLDQARHTAQASREARQVDLPAQQETSGVRRIAARIRPSLPGQAQAWDTRTCNSRPPMYGKLSASCCTEAGLFPAAALVASLTSLRSWAVGKVISDGGGEGGPEHVVDDRGRSPAYTF